MQLSNRITNITGGGSDGWDVFYKARRMVAEGIPVIELTIGEHDIGTDASILDAMYGAARGGHTGYALVPGTPALRQAVAKRLTDRTGVPTTKDNILIVPGGQSGLFAAHLAVTNPGDKALYIDPHYATYPGVLRALEAEPVPVPTRARNGFQPRAEDILKHADGAASLLINSPNNPTGAVYSRETLDAICQVCQDKDLWLISDEVYDTQVWEGEHISPRALPGMIDRTLVIGSMSKSFAMTGSRIGWIAGPEDVIAHLINLATHTNYGVAGFIQDAALFALSQDKSLEEDIAAPFKRRRDLVQGILSQQDQLGLIPAQGAMYVMLDVRSTGMSGEDFAMALLDQEHIAVMPGESFGNSAAGHVRVALTVDDERLKDAVQRIVMFTQSVAKAA